MLDQIQNFILKIMKNILNMVLLFGQALNNPSKYGALFYSFKDKSWAASQYEKIIGRPDDGLIDAPCHNKRCSGANSGMENNVDIGLGVFGIYGKDRSDPYRKGAIQIHEYTHAAQAAHWIGKFSPNSEHQKNITLLDS